MAMSLTVSRSSPVARSRTLSLNRSDFRKDGSGKLFLYAYGAYGIAIPPAFSVSRISLAAHLAGSQ